MTEEKRIEIYQGLEGEVVFDVDASGETLWATAEQMAQVFGVQRPAIVKHLSNIYKSGELTMGGTCSKMEQVGKSSTENVGRSSAKTAPAPSGTPTSAPTPAPTLPHPRTQTQVSPQTPTQTCKEVIQVHDEGGRTIRRKVKMYNLDAIISVGYRVNSQKATQFRIWATSILRKYLTDGIAINERRIKELATRRELDKLRNVENMMGIIRRLTAHSELNAGEANGVLEVISRYAGSFRTLKEYDDGHIDLRFMNKARHSKILTPEMCLTAIAKLRHSVKGGELFGKPRGEMFAGSLATVFQGFDGHELYPSIQEKAANLLYLVIKDHPFYDGNKRIGALLFIFFLTINDCHLTAGGETKISDRALTAIALLIAESEPAEKPLIVSLVCKLLE